MKPLLFSILLLLGLSCMAQSRHLDSRDTYRLNKLQARCEVVPEGDWQRPLDGMWGRVGGDSVQVPMRFPMRDTILRLERRFSLPPHWQGRRTIVRFDAAGPALVLYANGREVGYSENSKSASEWDLTRYLVAGSNRLEVHLFTRSTGSLLERQLPPGGITRSVTLYSVPLTYISDVKITASLDPTDYRTGLLDVMVDLSREVQGGSVEIAICGARVRKKLRPGDWFVSLAPTVGPVQPWCDTTPCLYPLSIRLFDNEGREVERLVKQVGFRCLEVRGGQLLLNGSPIVLRGINRPERSPVGGQYLSHDEQRRLAMLLKQMGFNAVRTLHHPADPYWYHLADSLGLFLVAEANLQLSDTTLLSDRRWLNPVLDRVNSLYRTLRNHPSVVAWSLGDVPPRGFCVEEAYRFLRGKDNSRPILLPDAWASPASDIACPPNPSPSLLSRYIPNLPPSRPCIPTSYTPAAGSLADLWHLVCSSPRLQGLFLSGFEVDEIAPLFAPAVR